MTLVQGLLQALLGLEVEPACHPSPVHPPSPRQGDQLGVRGELGARGEPRATFAKLEPPRRSDQLGAQGKPPIDSYLNSPHLALTAPIGSRMRCINLTLISIFFTQDTSLEKSSSHYPTRYSGQRGELARKL